MNTTFDRAGFAAVGLLAVILCGCAPTRTLDAGIGAGGSRLELVGEASDPIPQSARAMIDSATGLKGAFNEKENVYKVMRPRTDVKVSVEGRILEPFMGLTTWAAFTPGKKAAAMVAGDFVLFEDEISPAMDALLGAGLSVTALHNHFVFERPRVLFMHIGGEGEFEKLARGVRAGLDAVTAVRAAHPAPGEAFEGTIAAATNAIPQAKIDAILGLGDAGKSQAKDGMYKVVLGREVAMSCGCEIGKEMGVNTWFALCGNEANASCSGDFLTFAGELQPVLRALRASKIHIVAIHSHMEGETPASIFLHYWGKGKAEDLAHGFRAALDAQGAKPMTFSFDDVRTGGLPAGWKAEGTNQKGPSATWQVMKDGTAPSAPNVLTLTSVNHESEGTFNICWTDGVRFTDGTIEVKFRANSGKEDQGGGLIWRVKDKDHYLVARMNPLEDNFRVYFVQNGSRKQIESAAVKVKAGEWHTMRIEQNGESIRCSIDGKVYLEAKDEHIQGPGGVGVWTKADAASSFDDLTITPASH